MGLFDLFWRLLGGSPRRNAPVAAQAELPDLQVEPAQTPSIPSPVAAESASQADPQPPSVPESASSSNGATPERKARTKVRLEQLQYQSNLIPTRTSQELVDARPYPFAIIGPYQGKHLDLSTDSDPRWLEYFGLPALRTPSELADWLGISIGKLAWLTHRTTEKQRPETEQKSHYAYRWLKKRSEGWRLIEAPKFELKLLQAQILRDILNQVPAHPDAHGFVTGRSIRTNATPHIGQRFILKFDLKDFYTNVRYSRVVAIFRSLGYSREVAIWLARLTTSSLPWNLKAPISAVELSRYSARHLPQGGVTSPALANLSAFSLDVRLSGLARRYGLKYTRYADDLTFSGPGRVVPALREIIPLIRKIIHSERFRVNSRKLKVIRNKQRQTVTGVVVNERLNIARSHFDELKAILHNCVQHGPASQNRTAHSNFQEHLRGRIAHVLQLNRTRGSKLLETFQKIDWSK